LAGFMNSSDDRLLGYFLPNVRASRSINRQLQDIPAFSLVEIAGMEAASPYYIGLPSLAAPILASGVSQANEEDRSDHQALQAR
jgi:hypothetical protein